MALGEIFLASFIRVLIIKLGPEILNYFSRFQGIRKKLKAWKDTLSAIGAVLYDAEEKQLTNKAVELWLDDLKDLAYDMEDILDKFSTDLLRHMVEEKNQAGMSKVWGLFPKVKLHFNLNSEIEEIAGRLQKISERKDMLGLKYVEVASSNTKASQRIPSSYVLDGPVVGRDRDRANIVEILLSKDEPCATNFHVVAIVGMPGLGKTTLAGHVFNDEAMEHFNLKVWVSVSDNFDVVRVTKTIFKSVTSWDCDLDEFSKVQDNLSKALAGKRFLIVLDDVWNTCDYGTWTTLQSPFRVGALGSKIVMTTRDAKVAKMMGAIAVHNLEPLANDQCLKVFEQHAFPDIKGGRPSNFELLEEKIIARCSGLPLAARTLGGLLRCEEPDRWVEILDNNLWSLIDERNTLPVLKLSYHYLPSNLKRCFAYCSVFPNNYEFGKRQLILLWMADGLLQQPKGNNTMENVGGDYIGELLSRSLFQKSNKNNSAYVMHDLVGDLARWAAGEMCIRLDDKVDGRCSPKTRHSSYIAGQYDGVKKFEVFSEAKGLRTFLPLPLSKDPKNYLTSKVTLDLLPKLQYLRVLSFNGYQITELRNSIGKLNLVRYLDLSHTLITSLPDSICTLYNLQTLILESCSKLKALPANIRNLTNLRHLNNSNVLSLEGMPLHLSELTILQTLPNFVVGEGRHQSRVGEIGPLSLLRGTLRLSRLENVIDAEEARQTDLINNKDGVDSLQLEWSDSRENDEVVLGMLIPHGNLKELNVIGYGGLKFPKWTGNPSFSSMVRVRLENCNYCLFLPPLGQLISLKELYIGGMSQVETVGVEFYGNGDLSFPQLETLEFENLPQWKKWFPCEGERGIGVFQCLKKLSINNCPELEGRLPENLDSLSELLIGECDQLVVSIGSYKKVCKLDIRCCKAVVHDQGAVEYESLEVVALALVTEVRLQKEMEGFMNGLKKVKSLAIGGCEDLTSVWKSEDKYLQHLISLEELITVGCSYLPIVHFHSLTSLFIHRCPGLVSLPNQDSFPPSLKEITVEHCDSLMYFTRYQIPPYLRRIEIRECKQLKVLVEEDEASSSCHLEYLVIEHCPSLLSLFFRGHLPRELYGLSLRYCAQLESISHDGWLPHNTCLEYIIIEYCANLKSLPEGLCHLSSLQILFIEDCASLVSFPSGGLPTTASKLKSICLGNCERLEALPKGMDKHNLNSLRTLKIGICQGLASILEEGFPLNLTKLIIMDAKRCKSLSEWGLHLHRLTSLKELWLVDVDPDMACFPAEEQEMVLPKSLITLKIVGFPNLRRLSSKGFQSLTSLESVTIYNCPKLAYIPEGLPLSITQLYVYDDCPLLRKRYRPSNSRHWATIAHIPFIDIGDSPLTRQLRGQQRS